MKLRSPGRPRLPLLLAAVTCLIPALSFAQGTLRGTLTDASTGTPLQGAAVRVQPGNREAVTDRTGQFTISPLPAGTYTVEASYLGLEPKTTRVNVADNQTAR